MNVIKMISGYIVKKPLMSYFLVATILYICEFLNSIISIFPVEILFLIEALRTILAFKIVKYLKYVLSMMEQEGEQIKLDYVCKNYYQMAIIAYSVLAIVNSADVFFSALSAICGLYSNMPLYFCVVATEYFLDVMGITCLFLAHLRSEVTYSKIDPTWIISNAVLILCSVDAFLYMLELRDEIGVLNFLFFYISLVVFFTLRIKYTFQIQDKIKKICNEN